MIGPNAYFSCSISLAAQAHIAFFSRTLSIASGCKAVYDVRGILPLETTPQIDSSSSRPRRAAYLVQSEEFSSSGPSRTWLLIRQEIGTIWPNRARLVWFEWQFPQARAPNP